MKGKRRQNLCQLALSDDLKMAEITWNSASNIRSKKFCTYCKFCSRASWTLYRRNVSNCSKDNTKQLLYGQFHQNWLKPLNKPLNSVSIYNIFFHSLDLNWGRWSATTMRFSWKTILEDMRSINNNPRRHEINQEQKKCRNQTPHRDHQCVDYNGLLRMMDFTCTVASIKN